MQLANMLVASNTFPAKNVQEFIYYREANPVKIPWPHRPLHLGACIR